MIIVVEELMKDPRVDPSAMDNRAMKLAKQHNYKETIDALSRDPRCLLGR